MKTARLVLICLWTLGIFAPIVYAIDSSFSGNYVIPESQSGFYTDQYENSIGKKLERGAQNFFLGWLEVPHGVKSEIYFRKQESLPVGIESVFIGTFKGILNAVGRTGVGLYEVFTFTYPQGPIVQEMHEWLF